MFYILLATRFWKEKSSYSSKISIVKRTIRILLQDKIKEYLGPEVKQQLAVLVGMYLLYLHST